MLAAMSFTLSWTHSVEKITWSEHWALTDAGLVVTQASVEGSGAGMDPPPDARFVDGRYVYTPDLPPQKELILAASGATVGGWTLCSGGTCRVIGARAEAPIHIRRCDPKTK
ncbi:DUF1850 domain-containing protein [Pararhizobium mangrovi]|uniref:DUF1850 domain-containing protein n=2 Tax=Pararhizobium mangrovi TaxID=2590452 RepID=A0A506TY45_9HYPH|nr:DUF1850 domain-containing protein [Pararhizobium mangrovi]